MYGNLAEVNVTLTIACTTVRLSFQYCWKGKDTSGWLFATFFFKCEYKINAGHYFFKFHGLIKILLKVKTEAECQRKLSEVKFMRKENILLQEAVDTL